MPDYYWSGDADFTWQVSGTDDGGCTYDGAAALDGVAELAIFDDPDEYSVTVRSTTPVQVPVVVDCPDTDPETVMFNPLNTSTGDADHQPLPAPPVTALAGSTTYPPNADPEGEVHWSWDLHRNS